MFLARETFFFRCRNQQSIFQQCSRGIMINRDPENSHWCILLHHPGISRDPFLATTWELISDRGSQRITEPDSEVIVPKLVNDASVNSNGGKTGE